MRAEEPHPDLGQLDLVRWVGVEPCDRHRELGPRGLPIVRVRLLHHQRFDYCAHAYADLRTAYRLGPLRDSLQTADYPPAPPGCPPA